jgi:hypothetical protein
LGIEAHNNQKREKSMESKSPHRGIDMHRLPVGGDFPGLVFAFGSALIFLIAIPALWYVVAGALVIGLVIAAVLQIIHDNREKSQSNILKLPIS